MCLPFDVQFICEGNVIELALICERILECVSVYMKIYINMENDQGVS